MSTNIFDNIINTEVANGTIAEAGIIDPSLTNNIIPVAPDPTATVNPADIRDNRTAPDTGKLIHNWWVSYMKSLKKFFNDTFDDSIVNYEFNYASKSMLLKRLYNNIQAQNPSCIINLEFFTSDSNLDPKRRNSGFYNMHQTIPLAKNLSKYQELSVDFKFVNLRQTIIINFNDSSDVLNYYDRLTTVYPLNIEFISYDYKTFINIHAETMDWDMNKDTTEGVIIDAAELGSDNYAGMNAWEEFMAPQRWAEYICTPNFLIEGITQSVDKQNEKYQLQIAMTTRLRVPQTLLVRAANEIGIKAIQVVIDLGESETNLDLTGANHSPASYSDSAFKPICIDMDRNIYSSYKNDKSLFLDPNINIVQIKTDILDNSGNPSGYYLNDGYLILPSYFENIMNQHGAALFIVQDSTIANPRLYWSELGILTKKPELATVDPEYDELTNVNRYYTVEVWDQDKINQVYQAQSYFSDGQNASEIPQGPIEVLVTKIPNFNEWSEAFSEVGPWFYIKLLTFTTYDPDENGL